MNDKVHLGFSTRIFIILYFIFSLSVVIIILESRHLHTDEFTDIHELHPELKSGLTPNDKCWKNETFSIEEKCDLCTGKLNI